MENTGRRIETGRVVISAAGRGKGRYAVVVGYDGSAYGESGFAYIADGKEHKLAKPKRKNIKHINVTNETIDMTDLTDKKLRRLFHGRNN
jgi:ribosomal protein L14E/L6E/L27E